MPPLAAANTLAPERQSLPLRLNSLIAELSKPRQAIEAAFLDVGAELGEASVLLDRIIAAFAALPRDLDGAEMTEAIDRLGAFARRTREIAEAFAAEQGDLRRLLDAVDAATHPIHDLRRSVRMMGILAVNARIVAAGLSDAADHFDVFTTDIANLSGGAASTVAAFGAGHEHLATAVHAAAGQFAEFEGAHRETLLNLAGNLDSGLIEIVARRQQSAGRSAETARVAQQVGTRVASAVMALQVGDATRQRVQHGEEMLEALAHWDAGEAVAGVTVEAADRAELSAIVLELAQHQLRATVDAFRSETGEAEQALLALAADAETTIDDSLRLYGDGEAGGSPVTALGVCMRQAAQLLRGCAVERARLDQLAATVGEMVEVLLGHIEAVQEIEANMRLVGLNAAIKCAQLGPRGAALSVIAAQLRELTSELVPAARAAVTGLEAATEAARAFSAGSSGRLADEVGKLEAEAEGSIGLLKAVDRRLRDALATLHRDGEQATAVLSRASRGLSGHGGIVEALSDAELRIAELAAEAPPPATGATAVTALRQLRKGYSMEAERRIHDQFAANYAGEAGEITADDISTAAAANDDVLLF